MKKSSFTEGDKELGRVNVFLEYVYQGSDAISEGYRLVEQV